MKREYDFSKAVRGKFYRKGAVLQFPIYLEAKVQDQIERIARRKGLSMNRVVNQVVRKEVELLGSLMEPETRG